MMMDHDDVDQVHKKVRKDGHRFKTRSCQARKKFQNHERSSSRPSDTST